MAHVTEAPPLEPAAAPTANAAAPLASGAAPLSTTRCALTATSTAPPELPPELARLGPQYFHPDYRGVFNDLITGTSRYAFYDPRDPLVRVAPPNGVDRVDIVTEHHLVGFSPSNAVAVAPRGGGDAVLLAGGARQFVADAVEAPSGALWIVTHSPGASPSGNGPPVAITLSRGDNSRPPRLVATARGLSRDTVRLGATASADLGIAWVEPGGSPGKLSLMLAWLDAGDHLIPAREIDSVTLPASYADLSFRTGFNLAITRHRDGVAVAWRPLRSSDPPLDIGSTSTPPAAAFPGELRILTATPGASHLASQHAVTVQPLQGTSGVGPWSLDPDGALALSLDTNAVFLWYDLANQSPTALVGALPGDAHPTVLAPGARPSLLAARSTSASQAEVLLYHSAQALQSYALRCKR